MARDLLVDPDALREQVRSKYREVAVDPGAGFHFHTGRGLAGRLGYEAAAVGMLPDRAVESFAGVGDPVSVALAEFEQGGGFDGTFEMEVQLGFGQGSNPVGEHVRGHPRWFSAATEGCRRFSRQ